MAQNSSIIFITGGVRSGKSAFAEVMASEMWQSSPEGQLHYIAAMQPSDAEMGKRIAKHQDDRVQSGFHWKTWEKPVSIGELAPFFQGGDTVLLDCLTTWLNNELFYQNDKWQDEKFQKQLYEKMLLGIDSVSRQVNSLIIVSNELLHEPLGSNELILVYSRLLGKLHEAIVANSRQAYLVESGIPLLMKGVKG